MSVGLLPTWVERSFPTGLPGELGFPLRVRLMGTPARLEELIGELPLEILTRSPAPGWTMQRHAGHLIDLEELFATRIDEYLDGADSLTPWDGVNAKTEEAPHDVVSTRSLLDAFREARGASLERLAGLGVDVMERTALHPRLGTSLRLVDLLFFQAEHDDHHLARIHELRGGR